MSSKKSKLIESAQKNFLKGQHTRAADEYRQIIQLDPTDMRHRQRLAEILTKANQKEEAVKEYTFLAKHYVDSVHYLKAIAVYKQIQKLDSSNPEYSLTLAFLNEKQGLIGNASAEYASAVQIYEKSGENLKALKTLTSMLALDPGNSAVRVRIAEKYFTVGSEEQSLNEFEALLLDLKERNDENGFRLISERVSNLFGKAGEILLFKISQDQPDNAPEPNDHFLSPPLEKLNAVDTPDDNEIISEVLPDFSSGSDVPEDDSDSIYEDIELIDEIMPIDEDDDYREESDESKTEDDWEEEIDLAALTPELAVTDNLHLEANQRDDASSAMDIYEMELDELELEIDETTEPASASEPAAFLNSTSLKSEETFDLGKELSLFADEIDFDLFRTDTTDTSFDSTDSGLKKSELDNEDSESHYSLGLAYKEMGLFDEAIAEFIVASRAIERRIDALILQGVCLREIGQINKAVEIFSDALLDKNISDDEYLGIKYELALCCEASGELRRARELFTEISIARPSFSDVAVHLRNLQD